MDDDTTLRLDVTYMDATTETLRCTRREFNIALSGRVGLYLIHNGITRFIPFTAIQNIDIRELRNA